MAEVVLEGLSRIFPNGAVACDQIDLEARDGELLVLVGPSGSGKSTTLRLIAGLERPTAGRILIGGRVVNDVPARRRDVAMVFQSHALYPHWTARQNMAFGLRLRQSGGWLRRAWRRLARLAEQWAAERAETRDRVLETARALGLEALLDRMPGELSGGEAQRVALGRAIVRRPALFLFDEPLSNLDAQLRVEMRRQIKQLHRRLGTTIIHVTHDQTEALALGDRLVVLDRGKVQQIGEPREVYERPANRFVAGFIGSPPMNFFEARLEEAAWRLSANGWSIEVDRRGRRGGGSEDVATVGIRPEHIEVRQSAGQAPADAGPHGALPEDWSRVGVAGQVDLVEHLGDSCVVSLVPPGSASDGRSKQASPDSNGAVLLGKAEAGSELKPGEQVVAWFDLRRAHWFSRLGERLRVE